MQNETTELRKDIAALQKQLADAQSGYKIMSDAHAEMARQANVNAVKYLGAIQERTAERNKLIACHARVDELEAKLNGVNDIAAHNLELKAKNESLQDKFNEMENRWQSAHAMCGQLGAAKMDLKKLVQVLTDEKESLQKLADQRRDQYNQALENASRARSEATTATAALKDAEKNAHHQIHESIRVACVARERADELALHLRDEQTDNETKRKIIDNLGLTVKQLQDQVKSLQTTLRSRNSLVRNCKRRQKKQDAEIIRLQKVVADEMLKEKAYEFAKADLVRHKESVSERNRQIENLLRETRIRDRCIAEEKKKNDHLLDECRTALKALEERDVTIKTLTEEIATMRANHVPEDSERFIEMKRAYEVLAETAMTFRKERDAHSMTVNLQKERIDELLKELANTQIQNKNLTDTMETQARVVKKQRTDLENQGIFVDARIVQLETILADMRKRVAKAEKAQAAAVFQTANVRLLSDRYRNEMIGLKQMVKCLQDDNADLIAHRKTAEDQVASLRGGIEKVTHANKLLNDRILALNNQISSQPDLEPRVRELKARLKEFFLKTEEIVQCWYAYAESDMGSSQFIENLSILLQKAEKLLSVKTDITF